MAMLNMSAAVRVQQAYDHRLRLKVYQGDHELAVTDKESIPRSTLATWKSRPPKQVVTLACDQPSNLEIEAESLRAENRRLKKQLAAMRSLVMLLLTVLRLSRFKFEAMRLPEGRDKQRLLRSIQRAHRFFALSSLLDRIGFSPSRYHAWAAAKPCELSDMSSCPRTRPTQVTPDERAKIGKLLQDPKCSHVPTATLVKLAQRLKLVHASSATWYRLMRQHLWRRPRKRIHPARPTTGVRANRPNEIWHVDISVMKVLDGTRVYMQAVMDNFSRKVLAYLISDQYEPTATASLLEEAAGSLPLLPENPDPQLHVSLYCDGGVENFNAAVDQVLTRFQLHRVQAQIDVDFSNSLIEAFWRSTKHNCLFQQHLDSLATVRKWIAFYIQQHNEVLPHHAFKGLTPDETYFGTGKNIEADLNKAKANARQARIEANRKRTCGACQKSEPELHTIQLDKM